MSDLTGVGLIGKDPQGKGDSVPVNVMLFLTMSPMEPSLIGTINAIAMSGWKVKMSLMKIDR